MSTARHVSSTSPERVRRSFAKGRMKGDETAIRTVCMVCGTVVAHGPTVDGKSSHGLCDHPDCTRLTTEPVDRALLEALTDRSERLWGRHYLSGEGKGEWKRARRRVLTAIRFACGDEKVGAPEANRNAPVPSGDDTSKVAHRSSIAKPEPYVVTVGSPGGVVDERYYADFASMVMGARELAERYCHPSRTVVCGNWDRADIDDDGLTDAERELLEEIL